MHPTFRTLACVTILATVCAIFLAVPQSLGAEAPAADAAETDPLLLPLVEYARPAPDQALPASEVQFDELLSLAAHNSPLMRDQEDAVAMVEASRFRSWVRQMPIITASYSLGAFYQANAGGSTTHSLSPGGSLSLQISRPLYHWGAFNAETDLGILKEKIAQNDALIAYAKLCLDLRKRYYDLIVQKAQAALYASEAAFAKRRLDKEQILFNQGQSTKAHLNLTELESQTYALNQDEALKNLEAQLAEFRRLTGSRTFSADDVPDHIYLPVSEQNTLPDQNKDFQSTGFNQSATARAADLNLAALDKQLIMSRAAGRPLLNLVASVSEGPYINAGGTGLKFGTIFFAGIGGTWTLFDRDENIARTNALLAQRHQVENRLADTREQSFNDASASLGHIDIGLRSLIVLKLQLAQQQDDYRNVLRLQVSGQTVQTVVDSARDALLATRYQILSRQVEVADGYYSFVHDIFRDPALAEAPSFAHIN